MTSSSPPTAVVAFASGLLPLLVVPCHEHTLSLINPTTGGLLRTARGRPRWRDAGPPSLHAAEGLSASDGQRPPVAVYSRYAPHPHHCGAGSGGAGGGYKSGRKPPLACLVRDLATVIAFLGLSAKKQPTPNMVKLFAPPRPHLSSRAYLSLLLS